MSIGLKVALIVLVATLILTVAIFGVSKITFSNSFTDLEMENASVNTARVVSSYNTMLMDLNTLNHDWAAWDDTYNFVQGPNETYVAANITDITMSNAKLNYILIINNAGEIVGGAGFDLDEQKQIPISSDVKEQMTRSSILTHAHIDSYTSGVVKIQGNPLMFSAQPIVTSQGSGPVVGTIIMARYIDFRVNDSLKETTHLAVTLDNNSRDDSVSDIREAYSHLNKDNLVFIQPLSEQSIAGYALINDIYGNPAFIIKTEMPRDIYAQGQSTIRSFILIIVFSCVLFIVNILLLINHLVTHRLKLLSKSVNTIRISNNFSDRVKTSGNDELSDLGRNINEMLWTIQNSQGLLQKKRREEEVLRMTIESVADGLITFDINGTIRQVNDSAIRMHGYSSKEDVIGHSFRDLIAEEDHAEFVDLLQNTGQTGYGKTAEFTFIKKDSSLFPAEISAAILRGNSDQIIGIIAGTRDISERKKMQQALQDKERQYRLLVDNQIDLVVEINPIGNLLFVNPAYCKFVGKEKEQLLGSPLISQVYPDDREEFQKILENITRPPYSGYSEHKLLFNNGWKWFSWTYNAVLDDRQNISSITCSGRDITESKLAKEELEKANTQLKELDKMKDNLLSTVSHELRTPLTSIKSFTEILLTYDEDKETQKEFLGIINDESDRLTRLINDFLDLSKIQAGKMQWKTVELSVADVINSVALSTRPLTQKAKLELSLNIEPNLPHTMFDRDKLIQVFTNLLGNALKFTREGGKVTIKAWAGEENNLEDQRWITVSISDTGIGIAPENHHKIFENFGQVGDVLKDRPKGSGLGLPICKKIIEKFGGKVWVESALGQGTTFLFSLPAVKECSRLTEPAASSVTPVAVQQRSLNNQDKTILVVDDEPNIRCFLQHELAKRGYQVIEAGGGRDALDMARKYHPDLITLDISMPDLNGLDVTAVIKNDPDIKHIPILIISVMEEQQRAFSLGANDYLNKPISMELLTQKVNSLAGSSPKNILVVDDDEALTQSLGYELHKRGFTINTANSGKQALSYLEQNHTDLILLDLKMPEMDGFEVMKAVKSKPETTGIPIVILSGIDIDCGKSEALSNGAADYFSKTGNFKELFESIERILNGKIVRSGTQEISSDKQTISMGSGKS